MNDYAALAEHLNLKDGDPVLVLFNATPMQVSIHPQSLQPLMSLSVLPGIFKGWIRHDVLAAPTHIVVQNKVGETFHFGLDTVTIGRPAVKGENLVR